MGTGSLAAHAAPRTASAQAAGRGIEVRNRHADNGLRTQGATPGAARNNTARSGDALCLCEGPSAADLFEQIAYRGRHVEQTAVRLRIQEGAAANGTGQLEGAGKQVEFDFFSEVRSDEMVLFRQRTDAVADRLEGARQSRFVAMREKVAARFEFSMDVSGVALSGFSEAAEKLEAAASDLMDKFLGLADQALDKNDGLVNKMFELVDGFFKGDGGFEAAFNRLAGEMTQFLGTQPNAAPAGAGGQAAQHLKINMQMEFQFSFKGEVTVAQGEVQESDPIVLDLDGDGIELTHYSAGAEFDILGSGETVRTGFVTGGDAFLAMDRNGNGAIDDGTELFGDQRGAINGYEELRKLDLNGDQRIDRNDAAYEQLLLFQDDGDGRTEDGELVSLAEAGISEISLRYRDVNLQASGANRLGQVASYRRTDGSTGQAADAILRFTA